MSKLSLATAATAAALVLAPAAPAAADTGPVPGGPLADLTMSMYDVSDPVATPAGSLISRVSLECTPDGGTHPTPREACDSLRAVNGDFERLPPVSAVCPSHEEPVRVEVEGYWQDSPMGPARLVDFEENYSNSCWAAVLSDNVFLF